MATREVARAVQGRRRNAPRAVRMWRRGRACAVALGAIAMLSGVPRSAAADATAFWGLSPTPKAHASRGFAVGISLLVVGFEFEYGNTAESAANGAPSLRSGMLNGLIQTPTKTQLYLTAGGGFYQERLGRDGETSIGTNIGGGIKAVLVGPLRLRLDYRIFSLRGTPRYPNPQRFYAGLNLTF